jgi:Family of unknown function (DUF6502)
LAGFFLDSGLSIQEVNSMLREAAVRSVASDQIEFARRVNISGIAASTGIPRGEVSRILKSASNVVDRASEPPQLLTSRILAAWREDPKFTTPYGQPSDLKIYGRGATFEALVRSQGGGIPVRAILEELTRTSAIEVQSLQVVHLKTAARANRGITPKAIQAFGDRATELFSTMLQNIRHPEESEFIATVFGGKISPDAIFPLRNEVSTKCADFLADIQDTLIRGSIKNRAAKDDSNLSQLTVTIVCHESPARSNRKKQHSATRRNFKRIR